MPLVSTSNLCSAFIKHNYALRIRKKKSVLYLRKFFNLLRRIALDFWNYLNAVFRLFAFIKNTWLCILLPFAFLDCQNTVMLLKIYGRWVMRLLTVNCSIQNSLVEGGGSLKKRQGYLGFIARKTGDRTSFSIGKLKHKYVMFQMRTISTLHAI